MDLALIMSTTTAATTENNNINNKKYLCEICEEKSYTFKHNLYRHINTIHPTVRIETYKKNLNCPICIDFTPKSTIKLTEHLKQSHNIVLETIVYNFDTEFDFQQWKRQIESDNLTNFIKVRGVKTIKNGTCIVTYYKCHRSGRYVSKSNGRRKLKSQGSNKINAICPANIKHFNENGKILVHYQKTHVGHQNDISYLALTVHDKDEIAKKIASNVSLNVILDDMRLPTSDTKKLERIQLVTKQDLHNIEKQYGLISNNKRQENERTNVEECKNQLRNEFDQILEKIETSEHCDYVRRFIRPIVANLTNQS